MGSPKRQRKIKGKSVPVKRGKSKGKKPLAVAPPKGTYFAYTNAKGVRVKAGTRGAKRIAVKINFAALKKQAAGAGRIKGKFAPKLKAKSHAIRSAASKRSSGKATITRRITSKGGHFEKDFYTEFLGIRYRFWWVKFYDPQNVELYRDMITREKLEGASTFYVIIMGRDRDGNLIERSTPAMRVNPDNAETVEEQVEEIIAKYEFERVVRLQFRFRYEREG